MKLKGQGKKRDVGSISLLNDSRVLSEVKEWIPTMFPELDIILGGGWAVGRASEVFGKEGSGKSALAHMAIKGCQLQGGTVLYIDFEAALDPPKMAQLGIDPKRLIYCTPADVEEAWDIVWTTLDALAKNPPKHPFLIVWDSVAASVPRAELEEKSSGDSHVALLAKSMSKGCRKMYRAIPTVRAHMMWINQERTKFGGSSFMAQTETPGGKSIKYATSQRVRCAVIKRRKENGEDKAPTGYTIMASTEKCRLYPPHRKAMWVLNFIHGPSPLLTVWHLCMEHHLIKSTGGGYYKARWSDEKFQKKEWLKFMADDEFHDAAMEAYSALLVDLHKTDLVAAGDTDDEESGTETD